MGTGFVRINRALLYLAVPLHQVRKCMIPVVPTDASTRLENLILAYHDIRYVNLRSR